MMLAVAFVLAQLMHTPAPFLTPTPTPISERVLLQRGLDDAAAHAKSVNAVLGATVLDLTTGAKASVDGHRSFPLGSARAIVMHALTAHTVGAGQSQQLTVEQANTSLRAMGQTMLIGRDGATSFATPDALASFISSSPVQASDTDDALVRTLTVAGHRMVIVAFAPGRASDRRELFARIESLARNAVSRL